MRVDGEGWAKFVQLWLMSYHGSFRYFDCCSRLQNMQISSQEVPRLQAMSELAVFQALFFSRAASKQLYDKQVRPSIIDCHRYDDITKREDTPCPDLFTSVPMGRG